jgi:two-component system CheB/CheR fusion protein
MSSLFEDNHPNGADRANQPGEDFLVVGLGASAGGIKALKEFFAHVPAQSGMAYVVILHLSPDHDSSLAEVLQRAAAIPVTQVKERVRVEPNNVYVISPNKSLSINDGYLSLSEIKRVEERRARLLTSSSAHLPSRRRSAPSRSSSPAQARTALWV